MPNPGLCRMRLAAWLQRAGGRKRFGIVRRDLGWRAYGDASFRLINDLHDRFQSRADQYEGGPLSSG